MREPHGPTPQQPLSDTSLHRLPNKLWLYRKKRDLGQKQVAYLMGLKSVADISRYERSEKYPSLINAISLELALNTPVSSLFPELTSRLHHAMMLRRERLVNKSKPLS